MEKAIFDIAGMRCGACAVGIELALGKKKGIKSAKVSLNERMAAVEYDSAVVTASDIAKAVNDLGTLQQRESKTDRTHRTKDSELF